MNIQDRFKVTRFLPLSIALIAGLFIIRITLTYYQQVVDSLSLLGLPSIILASFCYLGYFYLRALSWHSILKTLNQNPPIKSSLFNFFVGESIRYIPGSVWSFIGRGYLTTKQEVSKRIVVLAFALEIFSILSITTILSLPVLSTNLHRFPSYLIILIGAFLILGLVIIFWFREKLTSTVLQIHKTADKKNIIYNLSLLFGYQLMAWLLLGLGTYILVLALSPITPLLTFISIPIFAWLVGYLSIIPPMGLGVREGVLIALLSTRLNLGQATTVAILSRLLLILVEGLNVSVWLYFQKRAILKKAFFSLLRRWDLIILGILILVYTITFTQLSILRHQAFASNFDLANMGQTVWNTFHGRPFQLSGASGTVSRFSIHADLILVLLSPLYFIWERIYMLLFIQSFALALGAIPTYFLSRKYLAGKLISLGLVLIYLLNPSLQWTNMYDFHGVALAIPLLLSALYFALIKRWSWFWFFVVLALTTKEEVSLLIAGVGIALFLIYKERLQGSLAFLVGITWFLVMTFVIIPHFSLGGEHWGINSLYQPALTKLSNIRTLPELIDTVRGYFLATPAFDYYIALLKPFGYIPILGLPWLLLALPEFAINLLSTDAQMQSTTLHYDSGITPFLIISTIFGLRLLFFLLSKIKYLEGQRNLLQNILVIVLVAIAIRVNYHYSPLPTTPSCWCLSYRVTNDDKEFAKVLQTIPKEASVTSSGEIRAHLTRRENSFTLPGHVDSVDYVAILDESRIIGDYSPKVFETALLKDAHFLSTHQLVSHTGHFYLFKRSEFPN